MDIYRHQSCPELRALLEQEKLAYNVLYSVLGAELPLVITDHARLVVAHTAPVFPTWVWMPDDVTEAELDALCQTLEQALSPLEGYRFNAKAQVADGLLARLQRLQPGRWQIATNMAVYECRSPHLPKHPADGHLELFPPEEAALAARLLQAASIEIGDNPLSGEQAAQQAAELLEKQRLYLWRSESGEAAAICGLAPGGKQVKFGPVYTVENARCRHYAGHLIYGLCQTQLSKGRIPVLYADADYLPSNRCYQNVGFVQKGRIVTLAP